MPTPQQFGTNVRADLRESPWRSAFEGVVTLSGWLTAGWLWWSEAEKWQTGLVGVLVMLVTCLLVYWHCRRVWLRSEQQWTDRMTEVEGKLESLKAENLGILVEFGPIDVFYDEDGLDGVMVAVSVKRIINRNASDAVVRIALLAPIPMAGLPMVWSSEPESFPVPYVSSQFPLYPPVINIGAKQGVGPGYLLFCFRREYITGQTVAEVIKGFPVASSLTKEQLGKLVHDSEMEFRIDDLAGSGGSEVVLAPGTLQKRHDRLMRQKAARATRP